MYVCNVSIASLIRSLKENASEFVEKYRMINAANIVIGKPNEKTKETQGSPEENPVKKLTGKQRKL